jgi:cytochrome c biogenesis protein
MKSLISFFSSVRLAIFLLIFITLASIIGTLIPQHRSPSEYVAQYGQLAGLFQKLQLIKLYQSTWFITLLVLLSINIIVCTLNRLTPKLRRYFKPKIEKEAKRILALKTKDKFSKNWDFERAKDEIKRGLLSHGYRLKTSEEKGQASFLARKKTLSWFGSDVVHLGLLVIIAGGIISGFGGFRQSLSLSEGQILPVPEADFQLRLDKFETELYPNGSVKDWKSTLTVIENEKPGLTKIIEVNHPLSHKGYIFYQSSYGWDWKNPAVEIHIKRKSDPSFIRKIEVKLGEQVPLQDKNIIVTVKHFIPDFVIDENNQVTTRSLQPNNPAAFIEGIKEGEQIFSGWIFAQFPDFAQIHSQEETDLSFELKDFKAGQYSVIQASKDPGANMIWIGSTFMMIGLLLAFYWPSREIRMFLEEKEGRTEFIAGGLAAKSQEAFQSEFVKIMSGLRRSK